MLGSRGRRARALVIAALCLVTVCIELALPGRALAAAGRAGSITVSVVAEDSHGSHALSGDDFTLVRVATAEVHEASAGEAAGVSYRMDAGFEKLDRAWASLDASQVSAAAHELETAARANGALGRGTVAHVGAGATEISFPGLEPGLYLVARTGVADANKGLACDPVLVSVPLLEDGSFTYDVRVTPKFEWEGIDHPGGGATGGDGSGTGTGTPTFGTPGWIPQTGDYAFAAVLALLLAGACALVIGRRLRRSHERL